MISGGNMLATASRYVSSIKLCQMTSEEVRSGILPSHFVIKFLTWSFEIITFWFGSTDISPPTEAWKMVDEILLEKNDIIE